ncbi:insulin-like receptor isoform X2 [Bacillus rossius redtenbacheri]
MDRTDEASLENVTFPELREITDYLLLYRVTGLRSVGRLFPNLAVVRGRTLFFNYALVVFEMMHLQEIGLHSLTDVLRGSVRIEKNPLLCYVDTVDWDAVARNGKGEHFIKGNRQKNECPMCPSLDKLRCPLMPVTKEVLCWNRHKCQKICPESCGSCSSKGECCHENCLGGCTGPNANQCVVCKDFKSGDKCVKHCDNDTYEFMNRRCISEEECFNMPQPKELSNDYLRRPKPWKPFNNTCMLDCPPDYMETQDSRQNYRCTPCQGPCRRECDGANVDSIASAQKLHGCTYIKGSLEIQIRGGKNIVRELEESLSMIEEIEGSLKIVRSFPLISLNFLKNLHIIHGKKLDSDKYAFVVLDNQNLQELWDWDTRPTNLVIRKGRLFFHFNPKLCLNKIQKLAQVTNITKLEDTEVAKNSNGDKVACNIKTLDVEISLRMSMGVIIRWKKFEHYDPRSVLNYVVYSIEAPYRNVTLYDGRDACGTDGWKVDDVDVPEEDVVDHPLTKLKPFTQYAFYVKTYTISTERTGAQSPIYYVTTLPDTPSQPQLLRVSSESSSSMQVEWQAPTEPKGNITHYIVSGHWVMDDSSILDSRNYCNDSITPPEQKPVIMVTDRSTPKPADATCSCEKEDKSENNHIEEAEVQFQIDFENTLHNMVYIKRPGNRSKREVAGGNLLMFNDDRRKRIEEDPGNTTFFNKLVDGVYRSFNVKVFDRFKFEMTNLSHFAEYNIEVRACRERVPEDSKDAAICSEPSYATIRTLKLAYADTIDPKSFVVEVTNQSRVKLKWEEPRRPNGIIVAYHIEYRLVDIENYKATPECIPSTTYQKDGYYVLRRLQPGNYSVQVRAISFAGNGDYTPKRYFYIKDTSSSGFDLLIGALVGTVLVLMLIFAGAYFLRRKYIPGVPNMRLIASVNPEYVSTVYVPDEWEVPRKKIDLLRELGQGSFGMVYEGICHDVVEGQPEIRCAIKTVNENATDRERSEFLNEASVMKSFNTHHVVKLLGVVSQGQPVLVVMELMAFGDLKTYLRSHRPDSGEKENIAMQPPTLKQILQMAIEIADGMAYLTAKKYVHRDLAARNCMVAEDLTVKIGDFGMTRDIYETDYYRKGTKGLLPVRWMAPESLKDGVFTSCSDVWSYGVVLWEMATLASQPYQGLSNDQVLRYVIDGGVMERPENCPDRLYELMRLCWQQKPLTRPSFMDLVELLLPEVSARFHEVSYYHTAEAEDARAQHMSATLAASNDPSTPLRITRDIEDFSLGDSDADEGDLEDEAVDDVSFPNSQPNPHYHSMSPTRAAPPAVSSRGSQAGKVGNGSTVTTPTTANGWIGSHQSNGTNSLANSSVVMKTTEC